MSKKPLIDPIYFDKRNKITEECGAVWSRRRALLVDGRHRLQVKLELHYPTAVDTVGVASFVAVLNHHIAAARPSSGAVWLK